MTAATPLPAALAEVLALAEKARTLRDAQSAMFAAYLESDDDTAPPDLLEAGANANDAERTLHREMLRWLTDHGPALTRLLAEQGTTATERAALAHAKDAMRRCEREAGGKRWQPFITVLDALEVRLTQRQGDGQAVAWLWQNIGPSPIGGYDIVARSLAEMDPENPPYPETWTPLRPLYTTPPAPDAALADAMNRVVQHFYANAEHPGYTATVQTTYRAAASELDDALRAALSAVAGGEGKS